MDMNSLVNQIKKPSSGLRLRQGVISAVNAGQTIDVKLATDSVNALPSVKYLDSFLPVVGTSVWLLNLGADLLAIGMVASNSGGAPTIASATTIAPTTKRVFISGTTAIATITPPPWLGAGGQIALIPTGIFTTTTAGNIALASTAVVSKALIMVYDPTTNKWYPSY
jgi:hypothetical protein